MIFKFPKIHNVQCHTKNISGAWASEGRDSVRQGKGRKGVARLRQRAVFPSELCFFPGCYTGPEAGAEAEDSLHTSLSLRRAPADTKRPEAAHSATGQRDLSSAWRLSPKRSRHLPEVSQGSPRLPRLPTPTCQLPMPPCHEIQSPSSSATQWLHPLPFNFPELCFPHNPPGLQPW